jgi:pSer/pThr/pTyr-binding forkhead associated (FHA) protein
LELGRSPVVFGRVPDRSNVIVPLHQISAAHARVWIDPANSGVWIEDLKSRNGTYIKKKGFSSVWVPLDGCDLLVIGDKFYLAVEEVATFEIESSD